ncbi:MAG: HAMP domain-containing histidine kinase [Ruminococcaceae bacterium]|nr:HAMP domain-containing histidine kinase [Oscillospiraceae bacterium]
MIRKLRVKFVAVCMVLVTAVLAVVFSSLYVSYRRSIEDVSGQVLSRVIRQPAQYPGAGTLILPEFGIGSGDHLVQLPYFTVEIWGSHAYVTGGTYTGLEDTETLESILTDCLAQAGSAGVLEHYQLRYLRQENGLYQKLAFVDMSMETSMLRRMMGPYAGIAAISLLLLLGISILLSFWVTRPVERAWEQQRRFLSDASHELKTPLTVILSNAELLEGVALEERPARWRDNLRSEALRMKTLVEEMLTLARSDNMPRHAAFGQVSLSDIAAACALAFEPVAFEAGKPLEYQLAEGVLLSGDGDRLHRLIAILLDNAIKYGAEGGTVSLTLEKTERQARLTVSNTGTPIPPEQLKRLFERFYRADPSRGEQHGFGLGLAIARSIAQEHRGSLRAESDERSTRFTVSLPLAKRRSTPRLPDKS